MFTLSLPDSTPALVRDVIESALPSLMSDDSGPAQAYNARLEADVPDAAEAFARQYRHACAVPGNDALPEEQRCYRVLDGSKNIGAHIIRVRTTRGGKAGTFATDGHTAMSKDDARKPIARAWAERIATCESTAQDIYRTVERYSK